MHPVCIPDFAVRLADDIMGAAAGDVALAVKCDHVQPGEIAVVQYPEGDVYILRACTVHGMLIFVPMSEIVEPPIIASMAPFKVIGKVIGIQFQHAPQITQHTNTETRK